MKDRRNTMLRLALWCAVAAVMVGVPEASWATQTGPALPWDGPLTVIQNNLTGTIAHIAIVIACVIAGMAFMFAGESSFGRTVGSIAAGGAIALFAVNFMTGIGFAGALV